MLIVIGMNCPQNIYVYDNAVSLRYTENALGHGASINEHIHCGYGIP